MRLRPLIALPAAVSLLAILTGCHLSRIPSPALSTASMAMLAGGILGVHLLIALGAKYGRSIDTPRTRHLHSVRRSAIRSIALFAFCCLPLYSQEDSKDPIPIHSSTIVPSSARYEIVQSTQAARWTFKLDRQTGMVYQMVRTANDENTWENMPVEHLPLASTIGVHYELFFSDNLARLMLLMNLDTGRTWQLQRSTDPATKENAFSWVPIG
jgi:hypothetical protein